MSRSGAFPESGSRSDAPVSEEEITVGGCRGGDSRQHNKKTADYFSQ